MTIVYDATTNTVVLISSITKYVTIVLDPENVSALFQSASFLDRANLVLMEGVK